MSLQIFWRLTLSETISDFRIFSSLFSFQLTLGISPNSVHSSQQITLHCSHSLLGKVTYFSSFIGQPRGDRHQLTLLAGCTFKCAFFPKRLRRKSVWGNHEGINFCSIKENELSFGVTSYEWTKQSVLSGEGTGVIVAHMAIWPEWIEEKT